MTDATHLTRDGPEDSEGRTNPFRDRRERSRFTRRLIAFSVLLGIVSYTAIVLYSTDIDPHSLVSKLLPSPWYVEDLGIPVGPIPGVHPIAQLSARGKAQWEEMLGRQSKSLKDAAREYRRRYGRRPPKGFDIWYDWATKRGLKLVDEFDVIHDTLAPFWGLSAPQIELRRRELLHGGWSDRLLVLQVKNGEITDEDGPADTRKWPYNKVYYALLEGISQFLPDMNITVNLYDEPFIFISNDERNRLIELGRKGKFASDEENEVNVVPVKDSDLAFRDLVRSCQDDSPAKNPALDLTSTAYYPAPLADNHELAFRLPDSMGGFIHNPKRAADVCFNPALGEQHGNYLAGIEMHRFKRNFLYPVFSWTRYPNSGEIMISSSYRFKHDRPQQYEWEARSPKINWWGSLTGMFPTDKADVLKSQRYRLMNLIANRFDRLPVFTSRPRGSEVPGRIDFVPSNVGVDEWLNIGIPWFPGNINNTRSGRIAAATFPVAGYQHHGERDLHKAQLDVDGWGWSTRFRELLWTGAGVLKATVYHESFSEILIPWYHYIPVDYAYRDLFSVAYYYFGLSGTDQVAHDDELRAIGQQGQQWVEEHATWDHQLSFMFRVCLEWARLNSERTAADDYLG